ncbi:MAG: SEC-C metal-binding domain-containing protein [Acidimicrobiia bacterium]
MSRQVLRKIDDRLRSESDEERGVWMAKVPISGATKTVWRRYCEAVGVHMGQGVAILIHHELASVVDEDSETLSDRLKVRQADLDTRAADLAETEKELERQRRALAVRESELAERVRDLEEREHNAGVVEHRLAQELMTLSQIPPTARSGLKLGRNDLCWCKSGKKYKNCHLRSDG